MSKANVSTKYLDARGEQLKTKPRYKDERESGVKLKIASVTCVQSHDFVSYSALKKMTHPTYLKKEQYIYF